MSERTFQTRAIKWLRAQGAYVVNISVSTVRGTPDLVICYRGKFLALELKTRHRRWKLLLSRTK